MKYCMHNKNGAMPFLLFVVVFFTLSILSSSCSSKEDDVGNIYNELAERLTDALDFDEGERLQGTLPDRPKHERTPTIESVSGRTLLIGERFEIDFSTDGGDSTLVDGAYLWIVDASRHFVIDGEIINGSMNIAGLLNDIEGLKPGSYPVDFALRAGDNMSEVFRFDLEIRESTESDGDLDEEAFEEDEWELQEKDLNEADFVETEPEIEDDEENEEEQVELKCGNGVVEPEFNEICDSQSINCENIDPSYSGTALCGNDCTFWDESTCALISLPDTGQTFCTDTSADELVCPIDGFAGQDAEFGTNAMNFTDNLDGTVTHLETGLMWQKENDGQIYSWADANSYCNSLELAGYNDWRLPDLQELFSIVDFNSTGPALDISYFVVPSQNGNIYKYWTSTFNVNGGGYWTIEANLGETYAITADESMQARCVREPVKPHPCDGIHCGGAGECKYGDGKVYCDCSEGYMAAGLACIPENIYFDLGKVHTRQSSCASYDDWDGLICPADGFPGQDGEYFPGPAPYCDNLDGTVTHLETGLMWQKENDGQIYSWADANSYCNSLELAGYDDWRLPDLQELFSIVDFSSTGPAVDISYFVVPSQSENIYKYWTSTFNVNGGGYWTVEAGLGETYAVTVDESMQARCVRPAYHGNKNSGGKTL